MTPITASGSLSKYLLGTGINHWEALVAYIKCLPYGRNASREDVFLVLKEGRGTCSSKHGCLKAVAEENGWTYITLHLVLFKMNGINTPKVASILEHHQLSYLPEAHTILRVDGQALDATSSQSDFSNLEQDVIWEEAISVAQLGAYKLQRHRAYLKEWLVNEKLPHTLDALWAIREECIAALSK
ncbi:MAG TPA: hypothetical protein PKW08_10910 [Flavobacteriaceae bacterium]|nr:hypothetical protein [Flavobacteriaceae bacterium]MCB9212103.1 hypothetical protein [Alteromonas sp.]HPF10517.1 hypothetical protein [Flavobacteriaceae bacterium]HQU22086.1 hypothetical protein [Flavobacteriaceae bacterium]HQU66079.1 hypothetical protein [Flavobacteriaceae bacterium]